MGVQVRGKQQELTSLGSREIKSRWNCGSITCIICLTCVGSQLSINSSSASSFSGPVQLWNTGKKESHALHYISNHLADASVLCDLIYTGINAMAKQTTGPSNSQLHESTEDENLLLLWLRFKVHCGKLDFLLLTQRFWFIHVFLFYVAAVWNPRSALSSPVLKINTASQLSQVATHQLSTVSILLIARPHLDCPTQHSCKHSAFTENTAPGRYRLIVPVYRKHTRCPAVLM